MTFRFSNLASGKHDFVRKQDLETGLSLQSELNRLNQLEETTRLATLVEASRNAVRTFIASPTEKNYVDLKSVVRDEIIFTQEQSRRIRSIVREAIGHLLTEQIAPWSEAILTRALKAAQRKLDETTASESERVLKLTGEPMTRPNDVIIADERVVKEILALIDQARNQLPRSQTLPPARLLEMFGFEPTKTL